MQPRRIRQSCIRFCAQRSTLPANLHNPPMCRALSSSVNFFVADGSQLAAVRLLD
jgi:hypothetical protein